MDREVAEAQRDAPEWLRRARAARAEADRLRGARRAAILARRRGFQYPDITEPAINFAGDFARGHLLDFLHDALDDTAADTYVVDSGYDVSTHARRAGETNRERVRRGQPLSESDECGLYGRFRESGTLGDLFHATTGNTVPTFVSGSGLAAETFADEWDHRWPLQTLGHAYMVADHVLRGEVETLETIAEVPLGDKCDYARTDHRACGHDADVVALADQALFTWTEHDCPLLDPETLVDMDAAISALPRMLLAARRRWDQTELLAAALAGIAVEDAADG
ncbi:MAG: hypothetical protein PHQ28_06960 [Mycobacterium sp.]|nr:hypothetical protein [Mycobacterium sp.]